MLDGLVGVPGLGARGGEDRREFEFKVKLLAVELGIPETELELELGALPTMSSMEKPWRAFGPEAGLVVEELGRAAAAAAAEMASWAPAEDGIILI